MTIGAWLSGVFGNSFKTISEKLTPEELTEFSNEAAALMDADDADGDDDDDDQDDDDEQDEKKKKKKGAENSDQSGAISFEERFAALENSLKQEKADKLELQNQLTQMSADLKKSKSINAKLRQNVNPLSDKDQASGSEAKQLLTQADIEAREAYAAAKLED